MFERSENNARRSMATRIAPRTGEGTKGGERARDRTRPASMETLMRNSAYEGM